MTGKVFIVGAGPGDVGLFTLKAKQCMAQADAIVYDRLVSPQLLMFARTDAEFHYVGKESSRHTLPQDEINQLLVSLAQSGKTVVRLKGGDPFVFGRGGEEALALSQGNVPYEIVPGITSAISAPAYAGIPVTHRHISPSFTVVTGHESVASGDESVNWQRLSKDGGTLIVLMGVGHLDGIVEQLLNAGKSADTPVALVRWGTRAYQETLLATLQTVVARVNETGFQAPAVIVIGEVVQLRGQLAWAEQRPLFGKRILVVSQTSTRGAEMREAVQNLGAEMFELSVEQLANPVTGHIDQFIDSLKNGGTLYFNTLLGIDSFFSRWCGRGLDVRRLAHVRLGVPTHSVGEGLRRYGLSPDFVGPATGMSETAPLGTGPSPDVLCVELPPFSGGSPIVHSGPVELPLYDIRVDAERTSAFLESVAEIRIDMVWADSDHTRSWLQKSGIHHTLGLHDASVFVDEGPDELLANMISTEGHPAHQKSGSPTRTQQTTVAETVAAVTAVAGR